MSEVCHLFVCQNWHVFNDMFPFFENLPREHKYFFTDVGCCDGPGIYRLSELKNFVPPTDRGIVYFSLTGHLVEHNLLKIFRHKKVVRVFHGLIREWAAVLQKPLPDVDVVLAASLLDYDLWQKIRPDVRVEIVGWPKAERCLAGGLGQPVPNSIFAGSNWSVDRSAFQYCPDIARLKNRCITFSLHPNLVDRSRPLPRRVEKPVVDRSVKILKKAGVCFTDPRYGVLPYMINSQIMLGVESSASFEWLLFDRPIVFLKSSPYLKHGLTVGKYSLKKTIDIALTKDPYKNLRQDFRQKIISHLDGQCDERFLAVVEDLESALT